MEEKLYDTVALCSKITFNGNFFFMLAGDQASMNYARFHINVQNANFQKIYSWLGFNKLYKKKLMCFSS